MIFFVTGGSRGIGAALVLAAVGAGHDVAFTYRERAADAAAVAARARELDPGRRCEPYQLDVRDSGQVEAVADRVLDDLGGVDVVVANAAVNIPGLAATTADEDWRTVIDTNLTGTFYVCRQFLPTFLANGRGRFVLISSVAQGGMVGQVGYAASKAGLIGLSGTLAREYGRRGVTSNVVAPGFFETEMTRDKMSEANRSFWTRFCPAGRVGTVDELTGLVLFLASDAAGFVNGQSIGVNGGMDWVT